MAIFVSNPTSAAPSHLIPDGQDPTALESLAGFTEELAAAMLMPIAGSSSTDKTPPDNPETLEKKLPDLQILPAEVLKNAVGDANFALMVKTVTPSFAPANEPSPISDSAGTQPAIEDASQIDLSGNLQAAELAAANLAVQMSAATPLPLPVTKSSQETTAVGSLTSKATTVSEPETVQTPYQPETTNDLKADFALPIVGIGLNSEHPSSNSTIDFSLKDSKLSESLPITQAPTLDVAKNHQTERSTTVGDLSQEIKHLENNSSLLISSLQSQSSLAANDLVPLPAVNSMSLNTDSDVQQASVHLNNLMMDALSVSNNSDGIISTTSKAASPILDAWRKDSTTVTDVSNLQRPAPSIEESAFKFDAKLSQTEISPLQSNTSKFTSNVASNLTVNLIGNGIVNATDHEIGNSVVDVPDSVSSQTPIDVSNEVSTNEPINAAPILTQVARATNQSHPKVISEPESASVGPSDNQLLSATAPRNLIDNSQSKASLDQPRAIATQSMEDLSSSFVSSLVGGAPRPFYTVMDFISIQAQERPLPVVPHEVRLDSGAVQLEIQKMVKQGGGHVVMELTPPDQSKFTIELKLDDRGGALLIVEGVSDSTRTRLEQSTPQLREQFQQMGLELQLDMRQQNQSASSNMSNFSNSQDRDSQASQGTHPNVDKPNSLTQREIGFIRARETGSNQVYLYA